MTGLLLLGSNLISVSIDATIRQWSLVPDDLQRAMMPADDSDVATKDNQPALTEEEEALLDELSRDD